MADAFSAYHELSNMFDSSHSTTEEGRSKTNRLLP